MSLENKVKRRLDRRLLFSLHGWFALPLWGFVLLTCATGSLCVISQEITWLYEPSVRVKPEAGRPRYDLITANIDRSYPGAKIDSIYIDEPYLACRVRVHFTEGERATLLVNPHTGVIQGEVNGTGFRGFTLALHGWLFLPWQDDYSVGWYLVTFLSIPLMGSLLTGLLLFKRFWRLFYRPKLRLLRGSRVFWGDLHRLLGVWSIWFVLIISISGLWFLVQGVLAQNETNLYPQVPALPSQSLMKVQAGREVRALSLAQLLVKAEPELKGLSIKLIQLPKHSEGVVTIQGSRQWSVFSRNVNAIYLNPYTGGLVGSHNPNNVSLLQATVGLMAPLHFGNFGGLTIKVIWFLFGLVLCFMVASGFLIWAKRLYAMECKPLGRKSSKPNSSVFWRGFRYISWLFVLLPAYYYFQ